MFKKKPDVSTPKEPSTMDRLLERNCGRDEFFLLYAKLLGERMPNHEISFTGDSVLRIVTPEGKEATTYLDNAWLIYEANQEDRRSVLERFAGVACALHDQMPPAQRSSIVASIKDAQYVEMFQGGTEKMQSHLAGDLWIMYAEDLPDRIRTLSRERMEEAGVDESELKSVAVENPADSA